MKKVFMSFAVVAALTGMISCACNNTAEEEAEEAETTECCEEGECCTEDADAETVEVEAEAE